MDVKREVGEDVEVELAGKIVPSCSLPHNPQLPKV
jgi:hypothetical protein